MTTRYNRFDNGLVLGTPPETLPEGAAISNRGMHALSLGSFRSRPGSAQLYSLASAHSLYYFADTWFAGVGSALYRAAASIKSGLSGGRLGFAKMAPVAGIADYLFCAGGGDLFKVNSAGVVTDWGFDPPASTPTAAANTSAYTSIRTAALIWTQIGITAEYYCELAATGNPSIPQPTNVREAGVSMAVGSAVGSLAAGEYIYADGGGGFSTVVVRLSDDDDPDTKALGFVDYATSTTLLNGTYQYKITYRNSITGHRSNSNSTATSITVDNAYIALSAIPNGALVDAQITHVEIWRTEADGTLFFRLAEIATGTTTYLDTGAVSLSSIELPTDNLKPFDYLSDCVGPYNASMFWITRTQSGQRGRLFYSPIGRAESLDGFIEVTSDDNPLQKIVRFAGQLGVIAEDGIFLIGGANPYTSREIPGCPGTTKPHTVVVTPAGVFYEAADGVRVFDGSRSTLVEPGTVERIFQGEAAGQLIAFAGLVATYARDEYLVSDGTQTLAYHLDRKRFRDVGRGFSALFYSSESNQLAAATSAEILDFEKETTLTDNGTAITLILEPPHIVAPANNELFLQFITIDLNTNGAQITLTLLHDGQTTALGTLTAAARRKITLPIGITGQQFGIRLSGTVSSAVEIFAVNFDIHGHGQT